MLYITVLYCAAQKQHMAAAASANDAGAAALCGEQSLDRLLDAVADAVSNGSADDALKFLQEIRSSLEATRF